MEAIRNQYEQMGVGICISQSQTVLNFSMIY